MIWQPRDVSGAALVLEQVISYCEPLQSGWQLSVPPETPPSSRMVAPLLTAQICAGVLAKQPELAASLSATTPAG